MSRGQIALAEDSETAVSDLVNRGVKNVERAVSRATSILQFPTTEPTAQCECIFSTAISVEVAPVSTLGYYIQGEYVLTDEYGGHRQRLG